MENSPVTDEDRIVWLAMTSAIDRYTHRLDVEEKIIQVQRIADHHVEMAKALGYL